jgi:hypothetical protein
MELLCLAVSSAVVAGAMIIWFLLRLGRKTRAPQPCPQEPDLPAESLDEPVEEVIDEEARQELQAGVGQLRRLLAEVDQRIEELRRLSAQAVTTSGLARSALERQQAEVFRLSRQGLDGVEIARRLELDVGEVELMLNLQRCRVPNKD